MTPARFRECVNVLQWSQRQLADCIGVNDRLVRRWASGATVIPDHIEGWLERVASFIDTPP
jgi:transcriptional regulator with XRE-family HTH domain